MARARGPARFEHLAEIAIRIIGEEGVQALTHRRLAERADVPLGSTTYWFESRTAILTLALGRFATAETAALSERFAALRSTGLRTLLDAICEHVAGQDAGERWRLAAQYAVFEEASRNPDLRSVLHEWTAVWLRHLTEQLEAAGVEEAPVRARVLLSLLDGLLLNQLADPVDGFDRTVLRPALDAVCGPWAPAGRPLSRARME